MSTTHYRPTWAEINLRGRIARAHPVAVRDEAFRRLDLFVGRFGVRLSTRPACLNKLTGLRLGTYRPVEEPCGLYLCKCHDRLEGCRYWDHTNLWNRGGQKYAITSEPYDFDMEDIPELAAAVAGEGLAVEASRELSWWYPGSTTLLLFRRAEDARKEPL